MDAGLGTASAVTVYTEPPSGLTSFTYAEPVTEIQGTVGSGVIGRVHHRLPQSQPQHIVTGQHGVGLPVVGVPQMISPTQSSKLMMQMPELVLGSLCNTLTTS